MHQQTVLGMSVRQAAIFGLLVNATVWGLSWIGFKSLALLGLNPLWMTAAISGLAFIVFGFIKPAAILEVLRTPALRWVLIGAGLTNICFNTAVALGDVLRVTLLFYLMPVWAALLAHWFLGEAMTRIQTLQLSIGLCGAALVLWQPSMGLPLPVSLSDWLGMAGGFFFALNNIGLRAAQKASDLGRSQAMFMGGMLCSTALAVVLASMGVIAWPSAVANEQLAYMVATVLFWALLFLLANYGVQYGAARLPANLTALIMLSEIVIAGISSVWLGQSSLSWQVLVGGALIVCSPFIASFKLALKPPHIPPH